MIKTASAKGKDKVKVTFALPANVGPVSVVGDFNEWDPYANPMKKRSNGMRSVSLELEADREYAFRYLGDGGAWLDEPDADQARDQDANNLLRV